MKSVLIIGLGRLGHHLCVNMSQLGNEVMIVDRNEEMHAGPSPLRHDGKGGRLYK